MRGGWSVFLPEAGWREVFVEPWTLEAAASAWILSAALLVALPCAWLGCQMLLRRMCMTGDAVSHAVLPGLVIAFLLTGAREGWAMGLGALAAGGLCVAMISALRHGGGVREDAATGLVFTGMFACGVLLVNLYGSRVDLDPECVLFGEVDLVPFGSRILGVPHAVAVPGFVTLLTLGVWRVMSRVWEVGAFDPVLASGLGLRPRVAGGILLAMLVLLVVAAFEVVGVVMVVAMLVTPAATAFLLARRVPDMLAWATLHAVASVLGGFHLARWLDCSTGAAMAVAGGLLFLPAWGAHAWRNRVASRHEVPEHPVSP